MRIVYSLDSILPSCIVIVYISSTTPLEWVANDVLFCIFKTLIGQRVDQ